MGTCMLLTAVFLSAVATNRLDPGNLWPCPPETGQGAGPEPEEGGAGASLGALLGLSLPSASGVLWGCSHCAELRDIARSVLAGSLGAATATALGYLSAALLLGAGVEGQLLWDKRCPGAGSGCWWPR